MSLRRERLKVVKRQANFENFGRRCVETHQGRNSQISAGFSQDLTS